MRTALHALTFGALALSIHLAHAQPILSSPLKGRGCASRLIRPTISTLQKLEPLQALWVIEEELNTIPHLLQPRDEVAIPVRLVPTAGLEVHTNSLIRPEVLQKFIFGSSCRWPTHPLLTSDGLKEMPFLDAKVIEEWHARLMASRSMGFEDDAISLKMGTDRISPNQSGNAFKLNAGEDAKFAVQTSQYIQQLETLHRQRSKNFIILPEVLAVQDKVSGRGFVVRDLSKLQDGHYYMPGFAIYTLGREIARRAGENFLDFWRVRYAAGLGQAAAIMWIRYGLEISSMHPQNMLFQLDENFQPTGIIVFRDTVDWHPIPFLARHTGVSYQDIAVEFGFKTPDGLFPRPEFFQMFLFPSFPHGEHRGQKNLLGVEESFRWAQEFAKAFKRQVERELGVRIPIGLGDEQGSTGVAFGFVLTREIAATLAFLRSAQGEEALRRYHARRP